MKTIKELEAEMPNPVTFTKIQALKDVLEVVDERIKYLCEMIDCDEGKFNLDWNAIQERIDELEELKKRIEG